MTPMMEQYFAVKEQYREYLLFYRLGDFYEMFFDDAITASRVLDLTLTGRDCGEEERAPMCGVPFHAADTYIGKLIEKGYKVAICEQTEDPSLAKDLVKREVVRVITPGTLIETNLLPEQKNNYLASVYLGTDGIGVCFGDVSTAEIYSTSFTGEDAMSKLCNELATYAPRELILNLKQNREQVLSDFLVQRMPETMVTDGQIGRYDPDESKRTIEKQFGETVTNLGDVLRDRYICCAVGALIGYISEMQKSDVSYIRELHVYRDGQYMELDVNTRRNLELTETMRTKEKKGSLLWVLDRTATAPGARLLRKWVEHPLLRVSEIIKRQDAVEELCGNYMLREQFASLLDKVFDLERLITKVIYGSANGKDLRAICSTASVLPEIHGLLKSCKSRRLSELYAGMDVLADIHDLISNAISEDPPFSVRDGGMIATGYNADVDQLRSILKGGTDWKDQIQEKEKLATGIKNLKIGYNKVFGYYIEVSKSYTGQVPERYIRKQTLVGGERYITEELKDMESTILGASDRVCSLEYELFQQVRATVTDAGERIQKTAAQLAELDVYLSFATVAAKNRYVKPEVDTSDVIQVKDGRHPVVEQFVKDTYFVPNDVFLDTASNRLMLITGPNMAGKSTYMRQVALITIMAQIGSFVPANEAHIGVVDKVFTRVGASDDLASGQSTFMLEMTEVAYILKNATKNSLIIYDEVGRGTSTYDGMSIARAIVEYTASKKLGAKTLFATHYHELTTMENEYDGIVNYNIAAKKRGDSITFLRKIVRGSTDDSYGIEVAKLAGLPNDVIHRAKSVLTVVEQTAKAVQNATDTHTPIKPMDDGQITFEETAAEMVVEELKAIDLNTLSPFECMSFLFDLQKRLKS